MKSLWFKLILVATLAVAGNPLSLAQTPEQLYQKALMKEKGEGAMEDAISLYNQIADNPNADQSLRAKALLHIGMCCEGMDAREAVKVYQRLVNNFPSQKKEVAFAWERLNRLTWKQPNLDRIGTVSSKGRSLAKVVWRKEDATTNHLINGEALILTRGTQPILHSVLQFFRLTGKSLIIGGILTILIIYLLIMLIIHLRVFLSDKRES